VDHSTRVKRIEIWLVEELNKSVPKPLLMEKTIELTGASEIIAEPFQSLVEKMKSISETL
jgi:hypothetical protein